jgi:hypothetical protein
MIAGRSSKACHLRRVNRQDSLSSGSRRNGGRISAGLSIRRARCPRWINQLLGIFTGLFFIPHFGYSSRRDPLAVLDEFRDMARALHRAGIEVILDVVYNHTAKGAPFLPNFIYVPQPRDGPVAKNTSKRTSFLTHGWPANRAVRNRRGDLLPDQQLGSQRAALGRRWLASALLNSESPPVK